VREGEGEVTFDLLSLATHSLDREYNTDSVVYHAKTELKNISGL